MPPPTALACVQCGARFPVTHSVGDCPACRAGRSPANLSVMYDVAPGGDLARDRLPQSPRSLWRWQGFLPAAAADAVTLGEGHTPLLPAATLGLGDLWIKDETRNPTWSFKDRLASVAITMARQFGAKAIAASSSGNAGAAAAAYAAKAGIPCIVFTYGHATGALIAQMRAYGAMVVFARSAAERWRLQAAGVRALGWYPTTPYFGPVVGSNPFGIEGYKTIAYEIAEGLDWSAPDWCVLPVCYGDALHGMWKGFQELHALGWIERTPRFAAAEVSGSLTAALASGEEAPPVRMRNAATLATSIGANQGTVQALNVLRRSDGAAIAITDDALLRWVVKLAKTEGIWAEPAAAAPFAAIENLKLSGVIAPGARVVALVTASGLKDAPALEAALPPPPLVGGGLDDLLEALKQTYGYAHA